MSEDSKNILNKLKELNKKKSLSIFIPSLGKKVKFLPFTLKQQKDILSKMPQDAGGLLVFNNIFNKIITDNCDESIDISNLNLFDRINIILSYRVSTIGNILEGENDKTNLSKVIKNITDYDYGDIFNEETLSLKDIAAKLSVPSLKYDEEINNQISKKLSKNASTQVIVSELFTSEILKYINTVTIEDVTVNLLNMNYYDKLEIVESLPGNFVKKILKYIEKIKNIENELTTVDGIKVEASNELFS